MRLSKADGRLLSLGAAAARRFMSIACVCAAGKAAAHQSIIVKLPNMSVQSLSGADGLAAVGNKSAEEAPGLLFLY